MKIHTKELVSIYLSIVRIVANSTDSYRSQENLLTNKLNFFEIRFGRLLAVGSKSTKRDLVEDVGPAKNGGFVWPTLHGCVRLKN